MASARRVPIIDAGGPVLPPDVSDALARQVTLGDVMKWGLSLSPPRAPVEIVTQDEYTHDVVLELAANCYLVYDTT